MEVLKSFSITSLIYLCFIIQYLSVSIFHWVYRQNVPELISNHRSPFFNLLCLSIFMFCILSRAEVLFRNPPLVYTSGLCFVLANIYLITFISFLILSFNYFLWCLVNKGKNHFYKGYHLWLFICWKTKLKKKHFFFEKIYAFYKIYIICRKKCFYMEKKVLY